MRSGRRAPRGEDIVVTVKDGERRRRRPLCQLGVEADVILDHAGLEAEVDEPQDPACEVGSVVVTSPPSPIAKGFVAWNENTSASPWRPRGSPRSSVAPNPAAESTSSGTPARPPRPVHPAWSAIGGGVPKVEAASTATTRVRARVERSARGRLDQGATSGFDVNEHGLEAGP